MRRVLALLVLMLASLPLTAEAQSVDDVAAEVGFRGYYVDDGVDIAINDLENLSQRFPGIGFVALSDDPPGGADLFADEVLAAIDEPDTVLVLSASEAGLVTDGVYTDEQIDRALDAAFETTGDTYLTDFEEVAEALVGAPAGVATTGADTGTPAQGGGGGNGLLWFGGIVAVVVGLIWWMSRRGKHRREETEAARLEAAKTEIREQMNVVANEILEFSDRVDQDQHPDAVEHYRRASEVFKAAEDRMDAATSPGELESLSDDLDVARWEMAAADAIVEGRPVPAKPEREKPVPCFFDPTHGAGVEEATLQTRAGSRTVMVCRQDAERLRRGERPEPRSIDVGGTRMPAPQAPRSSGGGGMDWLDAFSILVGGMSSGADYRWGRRPSRRGGGLLGGVIGGMIGSTMARGSRRSGIPTPPRRSSSTSRRSTSRSSSRSRGSRSTSRGRRSR